MGAGGEEVRHWPVMQGWRWIVAGFGLFRQAPGIWIGMLVLWFVAAGILGLLPFGGLLSSLFSPVVTAGFLLGCQALERDEALEFGHLLAGFRSPQLGPLVGLGFTSLLLFFVAFMLVLLVGVLSGLPQRIEAGPAVEPLIAMMYAGLFLLAMLPVLMALWFATARVALDRVSIGQALRSSLLGCWRNLGALTLYGLWMLLLGVLALLPFGLGLLILLPVSILANYCAWKDIFQVESGEPETASLID